MEYNAHALGNYHGHIMTNSKEALSKAAEKINRFAGKEGLQAHGRSVMIRQEDKL